MSNSRRESRVSMSARQNDALFEFETFKKKFLLANKHITKLNSTLSIRIEELNSQISVLYTENLSLRSAIIAVKVELKKEKERNRRLLREVEDMAGRTMDDLKGRIIGLKRRWGSNFDEDEDNEPPSKAATKCPGSVQVAQAQVQMVPTGGSPINRVARAPNVPGVLYEDDEPSESSTEDDADRHQSPSPPLSKPKAKPSSSSSTSKSRSDPTPPQLNLAALHKKTPSRRQSGLLARNPLINTNTTITTAPSHRHSISSTERGRGEARHALSIPRPASPAFGEHSPVRRQLADENERRQQHDESGVTKRKKMRAPSVAAQTSDAEPIDIERFADAEENVGQPEEQPESKKSKVKTASSSAVSEKETNRDKEKDKSKTKVKRNALVPVDNIHIVRDTHPPLTRALLSSSPTPSRTHQLPSPEPSSPIPPAPARSGSARAGRSESRPISESESQSQPADAGGAGPAVVREKRVRKSVNYTEPKLNTKMRKPDPIPPSSTLAPVKKRASAAASLPSQHLREEEDHSAYEGQAEVDDDSESEDEITSRKPSPPLEKRRRTAYTPYAYVDGDDSEVDDGADADGEFIPDGWSNVNFDGRRKLDKARAGGDASRRYTFAA